MSACSLARLSSSCLARLPSHSSCRFFSMTSIRARQVALPAQFWRGGTSKGLLIHRKDLPAAREDWAPLLRGAMGSPDPHGRQLDGMGGGLSSLSKVCVGLCPPLCFAMRQSRHRSSRRAIEKTPMSTLPSSRSAYAMRRLTTRRTAAICAYELLWPFSDCYKAGQVERHRTFRLRDRSRRRQARQR